MSEIETFFRFCPGCGKRFHIKLVSKNLVGSQRETFEQKHIVTGPLGPTRMLTNPTILVENVPVTADIEDFQYSYRCSHCGHQWTEDRVERQKVG